jgi:hypothetical protein
MSVWPTAEQELLLRAAVLDGDAAAAAYREWAVRVDLDALDYGSQRLLPLLYRRLRHLGIDSPHVGKLKGAYRRALYRNTITLRNAVAVVGLLRSAGIEALVLKGVAMVVLYYRELGVRPMSDFDILVRPEDARRAIHVLESTGWSRRHGPPFTDGFFTVHYGWPFRHPNGAELDLHWYLLDQSCAPGADADLWQAARPAEVEGSPVRVLNPTDQLLHVCVHGAEWDTVPNLRWVADAVVILKQAADQLDWSRLVSQATRHGVVVAMHATLTYVRDHFAADVPESALRALRAAPATRQQRVEFRWRASRPRRLHPLLKIWFGYLRDRRTRPESAGPWFVAFPGYLQRRWGTTGLWQLPRAGLSLLAEELGIRRAGSR